jgi:hypothetical protein
MWRQKFGTPSRQNAQGNSFSPEMAARKRRWEIELDVILDTPPRRTRIGVDVDEI